MRNRKFNDVRPVHPQVIEIMSFFAHGMSQQRPIDPTEDQRAFDATNTKVTPPNGRRGQRPVLARGLAPQIVSLSRDSDLRNLDRASDAHQRQSREHPTASADLPWPGIWTPRPSRMVVCYAPHEPLDSAKNTRPERTRYRLLEQLLLARRWERRKQFVCPRGFCDVLVRR